MNDNAAEDSAEYRPLVSFPDQSPSFVYGFEAGMVWQIIEAGDVAEFDRMLRTENREVIQRMCVAAGWTVDVKPASVEGWDACVFQKTKKAPEHSNPHGLRVV